MAKFRPVLLFSACCCLFLSAPLFAQPRSVVFRSVGRGGYFQTLLREARAHIHEIGPARLRELRAATPAPVLVDVREDNEWIRGRIPGAIHVGRGVLELAIESRIPDKSTPIVAYCASGARSAVAADVLGKMGYTNVLSLAGGMAGYQAAGLPVDRSTPPSY